MTAKFSVTMFFERQNFLSFMIFCLEIFGTKKFDKILSVVTTVTNVATVTTGGGGLVGVIRHFSPCPVCKCGIYGCPMVPRRYPMVPERCNMLLGR